MAFVASSAGHMPFHDAGETYVDAHHQHHPYASMPDHYPQHVPHHMSCDIKPRLTKEQHDILEAHYQKQQKPNTNTKKGFADSLGVSLDKVNNWFQNRRAKSKQDAKKQAGAFNLFAQQQQPASANYPSDSDTSPSFSSADYFSMMQQCTADDNNISTSMPMASMPQFPNQVNGLPFSHDTTPNEQFTNGAMGQQLQGDMFDSPQELNRRTLTQEQFDAFAQNGGMMRSGQFDTLHNGFSGDSDVLQQVFPEMQGEFKPQDAFAFPAPIGAPLSSNDSSVPSTISELSMFPSSTAMQEQYSVSAPTSDWGDSRSSSVSLPQEHQFQQVPASQQAPSASTSQWQPGQSVPVDPNDLQQQFREAAQRQQQFQQQQHQIVQHEQPLAWPADEAFVRRDSQNGMMLAQQMSSFAIQTPQPQQNATFKTPAHPGDQSASIAVRRQRPKPQPLGTAALRSQSYSGAVQPASPGQQQTSTLAAPGQQLRRIRSSNVINGVAQGRVMKSGTGSAQRSPLNWTFADAAANSPKILRHASSSSMGNLAPPTPMSPNEAAARQEQNRPQFPPWQSASGHFSRQASISETDDEHNVPPMPSQSVPPQPVSSPPHTPLYHHHHHQQPQQFSQTRVGNNVITENTPPQSAPASQTSFPANVIMVPQQQQPMPQPQQPQQMQMQAFMPPQQQQQQQYMTTSVPEQHFQVPASYGPAQHFVIPAPEGPSQMSMQFASGGVPVVNAQGNLTLAYPPQMQQMQFIQHAPPQTQGQQQPQPHMQTPPQGGQQFSFVTTSGVSPGLSVTTQMPKPHQPAAELFVHEYSPPQDIKRTATPRKPPTGQGIKTFTFANQGPEHFEKEKVRKGDKSGTASNSPASATSSS